MYKRQGLSYPATGSTGSGYAMAQAIGHTIIEPTGSLVPLVEKGHDLSLIHISIFFWPLEKA